MHFYLCTILIKFPIHFTCSILWLTLSKNKLLFLENSILCFILCIYWKITYNTFATTAALKLLTPERFATIMLPYYIIFIFWLDLFVIRLLSLMGPVLWANRGFQRNRLGANNNLHVIFSGAVIQYRFSQRNLKKMSRKFTWFF
jgi:hypothetical protein